MTPESALMRVLLREMAAVEAARVALNEAKVRLQHAVREAEAVCSQQERSWLAALMGSKRDS
jgi:hypothetical protein